MQDYSKESDEVLVKLYEQGNDDAFDVLLERHQQVIYSYIFAIIRDEDKANDLFQETFYRAITNIRSHRYTETGRFQAWLMRIARNLVIDAVRHCKLIVDIPDDVERDRILNDPSLIVGNVEMSYHNEQTYIDLEHMITLLPEAQQEVVRMRIYENRPFKEIAVRTHCSINTALGRMRYAVLNLRKMAAHRDLTILEA